MTSEPSVEVEGAVPPVPSVEPPTRRKRRWPWIVTAVALILAALIVAAIALPVGRDDDGGEQAAAWDPRVVDLVQFVEETRGLTFDHPVPIDFLSEKAFDAELTSSNTDLTQEERRSLKATEAAFRALGLIGEDVDLLDELNALSAGGVAAFYDSERDRVFAPEGEMSPMLRATLVHELTHALQDQRFDLDRFADAESSDRASAFRAVAEGDAQRIEQDYVAAMSPADARAYGEESEAIQDEVTAGLKGVPTVLVSLFASPYSLGQGLMSILTASGGQSRIDEAFTDPPTSEEQLLDPLTFLEGDQPIDVPTPELAPGETEVDSGDFGAISWYLLLASRLDPRTALAAVDGWGGDAYVVYDAGSTTCIQAAFQGDNAGQALEMERALTAWKHAAAEDASELHREGDVVTLRSCDEGSVAEDANALPDQSLLLPLVRASLAAEVLKAGGTMAVAGCVSRSVVLDLSDDGVRNLTEGGPPGPLRAEISDIAPSSLQACMATAPT